MTTIAQGNVTDATRLSFIRKALATKKDHEKICEEAKSALAKHRSVLKEAKKAGVSTDAITFALAARLRDDEDVFEEQRERMRMIMLLKGQPDFFDDVLPAFDATASEEEFEAAGDDRAFEDGEKAGQAGHSASLNKHPPGSSQADAWHRGWLLGQGKIVEGMGKKKGRPRKSNGAEQPSAH